MNLIVLVMDTLRYDAVGCNRPGWIETPNLDRLALESWRFDQCFASSFPTIPHRTDFLTGRYGAPFHPWAPLRHDAPNFVRELGDAGYATQLIHDTPHLLNGGHNFDWPFHFWTQIRGAEVDRPWLDDRGSEEEWPSNWRRDPLFDVAPEPYHLPPGMASYLRANRTRKREEDWNAARLFSTAARFLRENARRENLLLWVDCFDPHEPWDAPEAWMLRYDSTPGYDGRVDPRSFTERNHPGLSASGKQRIEAAFRAKTSFMDHCLGVFLDALRETGLDKKTALLATADHGTYLGEWDRFGKGTPISEHIARVPLFIRVPDGGSGRCNAIVQPQDFGATLGSLAGISISKNLDSQNVLEVARGGASGRRAVALTGVSPNLWMSNPDGPLFTVFGEGHYLMVFANPANSRLHRYGSLENCLSEEASLAADLRARGIAELELRGADLKLIAWLHSEGSKPFPRDARLCDNWPLPPAYRPYFSELYRGN